MKDAFINTLAHVPRPMEAHWTRVRNGIGVKKKKKKSLSVALLITKGLGHAGIYWGASSSPFEIALPAQEGLVWVFITSHRGWKSLT